MSQANCPVPPLPPRYRFRSLLGGVLGLIITLAVAGVFVLSLLETREAFELEDFELSWDATNSELRLLGQLRDTHLTVDQVLVQPVPARLYAETHPVIYRMGGEQGYWSFERLPWSVQVFAGLVLLGFTGLMLATLRFALQPHRHRRRVARAPRVLEAQWLGHTGRSDGHARRGSNRLMFQVMVDGVLWRFDYRCVEGQRLIRTADATRPPEPGDRFRFYCLADDPRVYFLPAELEGIERPGTAH